MTSAPSRAVMLFGTEEPVTPPRLLRAGPLTCELEAGNLRYIRVAGKEALRALSFIVRDKDWGTYNPKIGNLEVRQDAESFEVSYEARCKDDVQELTYRARITGASDGSLAFEALGTAVTDFLTNRTGFVILHPIEGVAGEPVEVLHVDGASEHATFPALIDPVCPFQDVRALTHEVLQGVKVTCTMEGDAFEMEDHRNWNDASYKTYVRPLAKPWPYMIKAGETTEQSVRLALDGEVPQAAAGGGAAPVRVSVGGRAGTMPRIGLSLRPEHLEATLVAADAIRRLAPQFLVCPFDSRIADGYAGPAVVGRSTFPFDQRIAEPAKVMSLYRAMGEATGAELVLEAVIACQDEDGEPSADEGIMRRDIDAIRAAADLAGVRFARVSVSPACDLKCTLPGSVWPPCSAARGDLCRGARGVPRCATGWRHVLLLHRAQPQAAAGRPSRLRGAHDLSDRARLRRPHRDGEPRGPAAHHPECCRFHPRQALPGRPEQHRRARQSVRRRGDAQSRQRSRRARLHGPAPARAAGRRLEPRLCRAHGARPRRCGLPVGASRRVRRRLCKDGVSPAVVRPAGPGRLSALPRDPGHGRGGRGALPRDHALGRLERAVGRLAQRRGHRAVASEPHAARR